MQSKLELDFHYLRFCTFSFIALLLATIYKQIDLIESGSIWVWGTSVILIVLLPSSLIFVYQFIKTSKELRERLPIK